MVLTKLINYTISQLQQSKKLNILHFNRDYTVEQEIQLKFGWVFENKIFQLNFLFYGIIHVKDCSEFDFFDCCS